MSQALKHVAGLIRRETGIWIRDEQLLSLEAALRRVGPSMDATRFLHAGGDAALLQRLVDEVTVKETFFFRARQEFDVIDWRRLHERALAAGSAQVRVWVAATATGEEAYTLALLASEAFAPGRPPVSILATDISTRALDAARRGSYGHRALRMLDPRSRERYFVPEGDGIAVGDDLRRLIEFRHHNLVQYAAPPLGDERFDLIACRNVLIYFDGDTVERVIGTLEGALAPAGTLVLGAADRLCGSARRLARLDDGEPAVQRHQPRPAMRRHLRRPLGRDHADPPAVAAREVMPQPAGVELVAVLEAANHGDLEAAIHGAARLLADDPLDADAYFIRGLAELSLLDAEAAVGSLRRALYIDPSFGLAAFQLGRAHEQRGDPAAAVRAYGQALRTLEPADSRHAAILDQVDLGDVAAACRLRARALSGQRDTERRATARALG
jgi:chemotaxis methyl-accepting protein methylase